MPHPVHGGARLRRAAVLMLAARLFEPADLDLAGDEAIELTPTRVIDTPDVTHVRYRVDGRSRLGGDRPD
jgi:hypothetical protein